jgi:hypothetical protein
MDQRVSVDPTGQQRRQQWTVTDRVSWFWCAQRLFDGIVKLLTLLPSP